MWTSVEKVIDLLVKADKLEEALLLAQEHSLKLEESAGYETGMDS